MARPKLPNPVRRKGSDAWYIRPRIDGKVRWKSLGTDQYKEALRRAPAAYQQLLDRHLVITPATSPRPCVEAPTLTVEDACESYREYLLDCERNARQERAQAGISDHGNLASEIRNRLQHMLQGAQEKAICFDFEHQSWWLTYLRSKGIGELAPTTGNLQSMARVGIETLREIIATDEGIGPPPSAVKRPSVPKLSALAETYMQVSQRLTDAVKLDVRSSVRDVIELVGDKPIDSYTRDDGKKVREAFMAMPAHRHKKKVLRGLPLEEAIAKAAELGIEPQAPKTRDMKRRHLSSIFGFAAAEYDNVFDPFAYNGAWRTISNSAPDQKVAFDSEQLRTLFRSLSPGDNLYWLSWLGLCTGARLNELCQMKTELIRFDPLPHIYFSPELRLKSKETGDRRSPIRSVPIHQKLIDLGLLDYAKKMDGLLFPSITPRKLTGRHSAQPSKDFSSHLTKIGLGGVGLSFHSLRHTFSAEWKRRHLEREENRLRILGQAVAGVAGRYGGSYTQEANDHVLLAARKALIATLDFDVL
ncbi:MAG: hypothetical protein AB7U75_18770 [Hyphomicrobiaceae bacterium]